jgi:ABC-type Fe3+ transport system permease subunit
MSSDSFTPRHAWLPRWMTSEHPLPWLLPAGALMVVFGIFPLYKAIETSLYKRNAATRKMIFDPTHNWSKVFFDERVWNALLNTLFYTGVALLFQLVLGMLIALLLDSDRKGYGILRAMMTLPLVIPPAVTAMMFLHHRTGAAAARLLHSRQRLDRHGRRAPGRDLAMDAFHGAHHAGGTAIATQGTLRSRRD